MNKYLKVLKDVVVGAVLFLLIIFLISLFAKPAHLFFDSITVGLIAFGYIITELYFKANQKIILIVYSVIVGVAQYPILDYQEWTWNIHFMILPLLYSVIILFLLSFRKSKISVE